MGKFQGGNNFFQGLLYVTILVAGGFFIADGSLQPDVYKRQGITPMSAITKGAWQYVIIVALVGLTQYLAIEINNIMLKRNPRYKVSKQQQSMRTMNIVMTVMIVWFALSMPTAMSLYWITTSLITVTRTVYIQLYHIEKKKDK